MSKSIIQDNELKRCFFSKVTCGKSGEPLDQHHILTGALRDFADQEGLWIWVTRDIHYWLHNTAYGVMVQRSLLKRIAQLKYEETHSREEWMRHVHKNYDV